MSPVSKCLVITVMAGFVFLFFRHLWVFLKVFLPLFLPLCVSESLSVCVSADHTPYFSQSASYTLRSAALLWPLRWLKRLWKVGGNCERAGELEFWDGEGMLKVQAWREVGKKEWMVETLVPGRFRG